MMRNVYGKDEKLREIIEYLKLTIQLKKGTKVSVKEAILDTKY